MGVVVGWKMEAWHSIATFLTFLSQFLVKRYNVKTKCDILHQALQTILKEWFWFISSRIYCSMTSWMILLIFSSLCVFPSRYFFSSLSDTALLLRAFIILTTFFSPTKVPYFAIHVRYYFRDAKKTLPKPKVWDLLKRNKFNGRSKFFSLSYLHICHRKIVFYWKLLPQKSWKCNSDPLY